MAGCADTESGHEPGKFFCWLVPAGLVTDIMDLNARSFYVIIQSGSKLSMGKEASLSIMTREMNML